MDGLDAFLDLCDADPDWDSEEEDDPFERLMKSSPKETAKKSVEKKSAQVKESNLAFQDLFGDNILQLKTKPGKSNSPAASVSPKVSNGTLPNRSPVTTTPKAWTNSSQTKLTPSPIPSTSTASIHSKPRFVPKPDDSVIVTDPFTRLRLFKTSIQLYYDEVQPVETSLKERNMTLDFFPLPKLGNNKDRKNMWTSGVLVKRVPGIRKSAKGNEYGLWEIHDLDGDLAWTVFLFGAAAMSDSLKVLPIGSLIDFMNPTILDDGGQGKFKLSVANTNQIRHVGTAKDFGYCGSRRKDGQTCMMAVNKFKCDVCIHHASAELKKLNGKNKSNWAKQNAFPPGKFTPGVEMGKPDKDGIIVTNFGKKMTPTPTPTSSKVSPAPAVKLPVTVTSKRPSVRMELQDSSQVMKRSQLSQGNHGSISFGMDSNPLLEALPKVERPERKKLNLDPRKTRHLTDEERLLLGKLEKEDKKSELPTLLVDPNPGSRNLLKFLTTKNNQGQGPESPAQAEITTRSSPLVMNRQTLLSMKKALNFVKLNGPIQKRDPNSTAAVNRKRKLDEDLVENNNSPGPSIGTKKLLDPATKKELLRRESKKVGNTDIEIDMSSDEFKQLLNAKSTHATLLEDVQEDEYFSKLERKEAIENKLLSTFSIPTNAVMCRDCKYVALSQSGFCREQRHVIRVVKANKRFFKCKDCGNRTMSLDRLPNRPCTQCKSSCWIQASVGVERAGPKLDSEKLAIRGDEQSYLGGMGAKLVL